MVEKRDQQFFDGFMMLVGVFVGIIAGVLLLGNLIGDGQAAHAEDEAAQAAVSERIRPIGQVALVGDPTLAAAPVAVARAAPAAPIPKSGQQVYDETCALCHAAGVGGAPMLGDRAAWEARLAQDIDVLGNHVLNGFQGAAGVMPAKGGRMDLSDDEALAALQHMIDTVGQ